MSRNSNFRYIFHGFFVFLGLACLGYLLADALVTFKEFERSVTAKGLSEREVPADVVIWPIKFSGAANDLSGLYDTLEVNTDHIEKFLFEAGIAASEVSSGAPAITDKLAQQYNNNQLAFRFSAFKTVTVYSKNIELVRSLISRISILGKKGIVFTGTGYESKPQYLFTRLNEIKPEMIEEATRNARQTAQKFAADSQSSLGKIKRASQGQFSITDRDLNNPHIKKIRVVSTVEYYLTD
jgi:uncharacterized protein